MKRIIFLGIFCSIYLGLMGQGIVFTNDTWENILEQAKEEEKFVFVEVYGTWCSACKKLEKLVFTVPEVASIYNPNFINVRINGDLSENSVLNRKWGVRSYPSLIITNREGTLISKTTGFQNPLSLIEFGTTILDYEKDRMQLNNEASISELRKFLLQYLSVSIESKNPILQSYFAKISEIDPSDQASVTILNSSIERANYPLIEILMNYYISPAPKIISKSDLKSLDKKLLESMHQATDLSILEKFGKYRMELSLLYPHYPVDSISIGKEKEDAKLFYFARNKFVNEYYNLANSTIVNRYAKLTPTQINRKDGYLNHKITPNNPRRSANKISKHLEQICLFMYRYSEKEPQLKDALEWSLKSNDILLSARGALITAGIYNKLEKHKEARKWIKKATSVKDYPEQSYLFKELINNYDIND